MNDVIYFDNAATTFPKPEEVYTFMNEFYREWGVNVGRGQHKLAARANSLVNSTRKMLLDLNHCPDKKVVFTHTATEALNIILQGISISDGYNIYLSPFEHNAVTRVVTHLAGKCNLNITTLAFDKTSFTYDLEKIKYQFSEKRPSVVVVSHASNVCGVIAPILDICKMSKSHGAINVIDMCQTMGLVDVDLSSNDINFAVFAGHKTLYAPFGVAGFLTSTEIKPSPLIYGGTGIDSESQSMPDTMPERYEVASPNILAISGLNASLKWIDSIGIESIYKKEKANHKKLLETLKYFDNIKIVSPIDTNIGIGVVSCLFDGYASDNIGQILNEKDIAVRTGLHCSPFAHKFLGTSPAGTVRFSVSYFNEENDFIKLKNVLEYINENS